LLACHTVIFDILSHFFGIVFLFYYYMGPTQLPKFPLEHNHDTA
jgi:hypothetical protein